MYGGIKPARIDGEQHFKSHDPTNSWDDGGVAIELAADIVREQEDAITAACEALRAQLTDNMKGTLQKDLQSYGAHQVRDAVVDYLGNSEYFLTLHDGELFIVVDGSNDEATFRPFIKLDQLLMRAKIQAQQTGDSQFLSRMADLVSALPSIARHLSENPQPVPVHRAPVVPRAGSRVAKAGGSRGAASAR